MNIRFLETMIWLSELKNFRATAERMNMTPAAISNRIAVMEQELGIRLFERDVREVRLTHEGMLFVEGARDIVARYGGLLTAVRPAATVETRYGSAWCRAWRSPCWPASWNYCAASSRISAWPSPRTRPVRWPSAWSGASWTWCWACRGRGASYTACWTCAFGMFWIAHGAMEVSEQALGRTIC